MSTPSPTSPSHPAPKPVGCCSFLSACLPTKRRAKAPTSQSSNYPSSEGRASSGMEKPAHQSTTTITTCTANTPISDTTMTASSSTPPSPTSWSPPALFQKYQGFDEQALKDPEKALQPDASPTSPVSSHKRFSRRQSSIAPGVDLDSFMAERLGKPLNSPSLIHREEGEEAGSPKSVPDPKRFSGRKSSTATGVDVNGSKAERFGKPLLAPHPSHIEEEDNGV